MKNTILKHGLGLLVLFVLAVATPALAQNKGLKVISYNIYVGMKQDTTQHKTVFAEWVRKQNPDVLALQEANKFTQKKLEEFAASYGHPYAILVKEPGYPVAITSRYPIVDVKRVVDNMTHGFIQANIEGYNFIVTHLHPNLYPKRDSEVDLILATMAAHPQQDNWLVMGDFNSISSLDRPHYDATPAYLAQMKELAIKRPQSINLSDGQLYYGVVDRVYEFGLIDALKLKHKEYVSSCPTKIAYDQISEDASARYDFIFLSPELESQVESVEIIKDEFTNYYSDHYPVSLYLKNK